MRKINKKRPGLPHFKKEEKEARSGQIYEWCVRSLKMSYNYVFTDFLMYEPKRITISVTRLGDFYKFMAINFLAKVAQTFW